MPKGAGVKGTVDINGPFRSAWENTMGLLVDRPKIKDVTRPNLRYSTLRRRISTVIVGTADAPSKAKEIVARLRGRR